MKRLMLDTCIVLDMLYKPNKFDKKIFNNKKIRAKKWKSAKDVLDTVINNLGIIILPLRENVAFVYSQLQLNEADNHYDPSDHIIISQAIAERIPIISSDLKFPFYREQGLDLIEC